VKRSDNHLFLLVLTPTGSPPTYQSGSGAGTIFQQSILTQSTFFWSVEALDPQSRVIGRTRFSQIFEVDPLNAAPPCL
jgi:hypothetical protein